MRIIDGVPAYTVDEANEKVRSDAAQRSKEAPQWAFATLTDREKNPDLASLYEKLFGTGLIGTPRGRLSEKLQEDVFRLMNCMATEAYRLGFLDAVSMARPCAVLDAEGKAIPGCIIVADPNKEATASALTDTVASAK